MDLNALQAQLTNLGVTLSAGDDDPPIARAALPGQRLYRASLYLRRLQATRNFLMVTLATPPPAGIGPAAYGFVQTAVQSTDLIAALALELDQWVVPAVKHALQQAMPVPNSLLGYQNYFVNNILNVSDLVFDNNVTNFFNQYPISDNALNQITNNFQQNIMLACDRIHTDHLQNSIRDLFIGQYPNLTLLGLKKIKSTGSDFHKGGKQVLILTFEARWWQGTKPIDMDLKVVYKPTDLEIDCLLVGNSAAVNNVTPGFQVQSLVEIFNAWVTAHPGANRETLPTYRILPRNPTSAVAGFPIPVRQAYGYIEFLAHEESLSYGAFNFYPWGASDFLIFRRQDETAIIPRCYRQLGQWLAIASTFSLTDLHIENVRIAKYLPNLIDLEISLTDVIIDVGQTLLLAGQATGGINGEMNPADDFAWVLGQYNSGQPNQYIDIRKVYVDKYFQNRLYALRPGRKIVPVNAYWLLTGQRNGMNVMREIEQAGLFNAWFARLTAANGVLVRLLPVTTQDWRIVRRQVYENAVAGAAPVPLVPTIQDSLRSALTLAFDAYQQNPTPQPDFMPFASAAALADLQNFDIPAFYHRIGTLEMVDSNGVVMAVPGNVTVDNPNPPPATLNPAVGLARLTFFAAAPTTPNVQNGQVVPLGMPAFFARRTLLRTQTMQIFNLAAVPANPGVLVPWG